jgi:hypothetical protein
MPWHGPVELTATDDDGTQRWWPGRWIFETDGWKITLDARPDHRRVWQDLHKANVYVMTHVMELCRADGKDFTAAEAEPVLTALHMGVSFALGRFAAPMLPVGQDVDGNIVWENWRTYHCDSAKSTSPGWRYDQDRDSLADLLSRVVKEFSQPDRLEQRRLQMMLAITAINDQGFVEQRITSGAAGLEHIAWQSLVLSGRMTEDQYMGRVPFQGKRWEARDRVRTLLTDESSDRYRRQHPAGNSGLRRSREATPRKNSGWSRCSDLDSQQVGASEGRARERLPTGWPSHGSLVFGSPLPVASDPSLTRLSGFLS